MKSLKLGGKIGGGFGLLILIAMVLGGLAVFNMLKVSQDADRLSVQYMPEVNVANDVQSNALTAMVHLRSYGFTEDPAQLEEGRKSLKDTRAGLAEARKLYTRYPNLVKLKEAAEKVEAGLNQWEDLLNQTAAVFARLAKARQAVEQAGGEFVANSGEFLKYLQEMLGKELDQGLPADKIKERVFKIDRLREVASLADRVQVMLFKGQVDRSADTIKVTLPLLASIDTKLGEIEKFVNFEGGRNNVRAVKAAAQGFRQAIEEIVTAYHDMSGLNQKRIEIANQVTAQAEETANNGMKQASRIADEASSSLNLATMIMIGGLLVALILGVILAVLITRGVTKPVKATVDAVSAASQGDFTFEVDKVYLARQDELGEMMRDVQKMVENLNNTLSEINMATESVANAASEISQGNQDLSERTQQQASAIEETASAIEEMTSSVKQNADNSAQANVLAKKTAGRAQEGGEALNRTVTAMAAVTASSKKISDIINVVNEIAFQTNLLALNAAVEAARAGEAGRGFAVVAGEVRNLAGRSATAAKEIQELITDSVTKVEQGNQLVAESGKLLSEIIENVRAVADTIAEISAASQEQATGIEEVNKAVTQMDEGVQQNAALVEEAASASEEMASAAEEMRSQVAQFKLKGGPRPAAPAVKPAAAKPAAKPAAPARHAGTRPAAAKPAAQAKEAAKPAAQAKKKSGEDDFFGDADLEGFEEF